MTTSYVIYHFRPMTGGLGLRAELLAKTLSQCGSVRRARSIMELLAAIRAVPRDGRLALLFFTSLAQPIVAAVKLARPNVRLCYLVRGDEYTWAQHAGRTMRARLAVRLQRGLARLGCEFIFASADLKDAFEHRLGPLPRSAVLPNTLGRPLPPIRPFDGRVAAVGEFDSVKNVEAVIAGLSSGNFKYRLDLYGGVPNRGLWRLGAPTRLPSRYHQRWIHSHGKVENLAAALRESSVLVLASRSEGFPNVLLDALAAGCAVVAHDGFPFRRLPLASPWRFTLGDGSEKGVRTRLCEAPSGPFRQTGPDTFFGRRGNLEAVLDRLAAERRDFKTDNPELVGLVESDWGARVREVLS